MSEDLELETEIEVGDGEENPAEGEGLEAEGTPAVEGGEPAPEAAEDGQPAAQQPKKNKPTFEERQRILAQKTWEMRETERRLTETENRVNATLAKLEAANHAASNPKPAAENFETTEEYIEALTDWKIVQAQAPKAQSQQQQPQSDVARDWQFKREKAMVEHPDFFQNEVTIKKVTDFYQNPYIGQLIMESDQYKQLVQHLGKNMDKLERIAKMSPLSAAKEIARIEDLYSKPASRTSIKAAPAPVERVSGGGGTASVDMAKLSTSEFMRLRNERKI